MMKFFVSTILYSSAKVLHFFDLCKYNMIFFCENVQKYVLKLVYVVRHTYSHSDAVHDNPDMEFAGWFIGGFTCFTLFPVYVPLLCCADKNDCEIALKGEYILYVYDTEKKEIIFTSPFEINEKDIYKGQYSHKNTDQKTVNEQYKNILYNTMLEQYAGAYDYVKSLH